MPEIKQSDFDSMTKEELELKKLKTKMFVLAKQTNEQYPQNLNFFQKIVRFFKKTYLKISGIALVIITIYTPIANYIATQRKAQLIYLGNPIWKMLDSANNLFKSQNKLDQSAKMEITTQDPSVLAPILLDKLNDNTIEVGLAAQLYEQMYKNTDFYHESFSEKVMYLFVKKNKSILEDELNKYAKLAFSEPLNSRQVELTNIIETYIDIIYDLNLSEKRDFPETLDIINRKCNIQFYKDICDYRDAKIGKVKKNTEQ